ncbi:uncharacterized protein CC84DRAFT_1008565 [Paraphaeosphaeria sporulosa]|uniref:Uncharacterized protein n=1 Tax=Paraphaeosphaeria sporulosa TaxID=1460663 RepID=A0A177C6H8_9PLEO|nr:uncharacterized protein CC84DRAFT_1008565 [Paraphaeosphaeria sporulosa]OAG02300.1 hypothetical protein CC84DRAFT_1008565 [Paraphaeosphaeria sporulosa]
MCRCMATTGNFGLSSQHLIESLASLSWHWCARRLSFYRLLSSAGEATSQSVACLVSPTLVLPCLVFAARLQHGGKHPMRPIAAETGMPVNLYLHRRLHIGPGHPFYSFAA